MDHLKLLGSVAISSRMKRLHDYFVTEVRILYRQNGIEIEPWCSVLLVLLAKNGTLTGSEVADSLKMTHPYIIRMTHELDKRGLLKIKPSKEDKRVRHISLSEKGQALYLQLQPILDNIKRAVDDIISESGSDLARNLDAFETTLDKLPFSERVKNHAAVSKKINKKH